MRSFMMRTWLWSRIMDISGLRSSMAWPVITIITLRIPSCDVGHGSDEQRGHGRGGTWRRAAHIGRCHTCRALTKDSVTVFSIAKIEERFDFPMNFRPQNLSVQNQRLGADGRRTRLSLGPVIREITDAVKIRMENEKLKNTRVMFVKIMQMRFDIAPGRNSNALQPRQVAIALPNSSGGCWQKLPKELVDKRCTLNIENQDELCFQYCVVAHKLKTYEMEHKEHPYRVNHYIENPRGRGKAPPGYKPVPKTAGLDSSMLTFPVDFESEALETFEDKNDIGIYLFECLYSSGCRRCSHGHGRSGGGA